jgi:hypothetical protein
MLSVRISKGGELQGMSTKGSLTILILASLLLDLKIILYHHAQGMSGIDSLL